MVLPHTGGVDAQTSALGYFITPCVGILLSIVCYLSLSHLVSMLRGSGRSTKSPWHCEGFALQESASRGTRPPSRGGEVSGPLLRPRADNSRSLCRSLPTTTWPRSPRRPQPKSWRPELSSYRLVSPRPCRGGKAKVGVGDPDEVTATFLGSSSLLCQPE